MQCKVERLLICLLVSVGTCALNVFCVKGIISCMLNLRKRVPVVNDAVLCRSVLDEFMCLLFVYGMLCTNLFSVSKLCGVW